MSKVRLWQPAGLARLAFDLAPTSIWMERTLWSLYRKEKFMFQNHGLLLPIISLFAVLTFAGCFSSTRDIETVPAPAPVVQVTPPPVVAPAQSTTTTTWSDSTAVRDNNVPPPVTVQTPATSQSTTTWENGQVVQKNTITAPQSGVVEKQTTTSWNDSAAAPSETTTTTTTTP